MHAEEAAKQAAEKGDCVPFSVSSTLLLLCTTKCSELFSIFGETIRSFMQ
jgi:hypothetical protein